MECCADLMGKAFNPFILFSLGWAVFSLCLTIYFVTQSDSHFTPPPAHLAPPPYQSASPILSLVFLVRTVLRLQMAPHHRLQSGLRRSSGIISPFVSATSFD